MDKIKTALISLRNVTPSAWVRLAVLAAALIGVGIRLFSGDEMTAETAKDIAAIVALAGASAAAYWKNNSFTEAAQAADAVLTALKRSK